MSLFPRLYRRVFLLLVFQMVGGAVCQGGAGAIQTLFDERIKSVVAIEFFVETEVDRRPTTVIGMVIDAEGLILLLDQAIPGWLPPDQLKGFTVYQAGKRKPYLGTYLGQDYLTGWHYLRAEKTLADQLTPFTEFGVDQPPLGEELWGIGLMGKNFNFLPFYLNGRLSFTQQVPQKVGFSIEDLGSPGAPVFNTAGAFVGWTANGIPSERILLLNGERYNVALQNKNGSGAFFMASEVADLIDRVPASPVGQSIPWIGVFGLEPVTPEVASFFKLENRSALVVSEILENSPADEAGMEKRDIIVSIDGVELPRFNPGRAVATYFEKQILLRNPGDVIRLGLLRNKEEQEIVVTVDRQPKWLKEAERFYFEALGITIREFVTFDRINRHLSEREGKGVVTNFVKANSQAGASGLQVGDLIKEIDGVVITGYAQAVSLMAAIAADSSLTEFVLLISRNMETSVIRVRLK
ncbi:MAG: PDZ domain-containing protein [Opitutaceae bacterium]|nr:PDZ domain-containing protein [Opitutaceae bacterium]